MGRIISTHFFMMDIIDKVRELSAELLEKRGVELIDITYRRESGGMVLRLLVDKEGGITLDECTYLNEEIGKILDGEGVMPEKYLLEVSSPGLDRPLKTKGDFQRVIGKKVRIHTFEPIEGKRDHQGVVNAVDDQVVTVGNLKIRLDKISKAKLKIEI